MKILMITPYVTIEGLPKFERNKTGFGYMVMDIAKAVGKQEQVDVLVSDTCGDAFEYGGVAFLKRSIFSYLQGIFLCQSFGTLLSIRKNYPMSWGTFIRFVYYWLMTGFLFRILKQADYDIVHIHGCSFSTELWMRVCKQCGQKYVVTLHGLNSFSDSVNLEPAGKKYERDFLKQVNDGEIPITVISTGMKRKIVSAYGEGDCKNITVVCNSFNIIDKPFQNGSIRKKYDIPKNAKVILYVGNISDNKNQRQMVDVFGLMPETLQDNTWVLFCGRSSVDGSFEKYINQKPYSGHLVVCGVIGKERLSDYYRDSDGVVLLSVAEGFGLSLIEGMYYGLPCVMFKDMDAFDDIFDIAAVVPINNRKNEDVENALEKLIKNDWNMNAIRECSKKFESKVMAAKYISVYKSIVK